MCRSAAVLGFVACSLLFIRSDGANNFTLPAEFEPQEAVWLSARPTESGKPVLDTVIEIIRVLAPHVRVQLMVADERVKAEVQKHIRAQKVDEGQISYWTTQLSPTRWYR